MTDQAAIERALEVLLSLPYTTTVEASGGTLVITMVPTKEHPP